VADSKLTTVAGKDVLLVRRFDRDKDCAAISSAQIYEGFFSECGVMRRVRSSEPGTETQHQSYR
jgi:hypothetical protein